MKNLKYVLGICAMGLISAQADVGDPSSELLNYSIFGQDSINAAGGSSFKTVVAGKVGTNGNVNFDGWHAAQIRGPLIVGGSANLGGGNWGSAATDTSSTGNMLWMGGKVQGNLHMSGYGIFDSLFYKGTLTLTGAAANLGESFLVQDPILSLNVLQFGAAPAASSSTLDCSYLSNHWDCGGQSYDTLPAGSYRDLSAPGGTGVMKFGAGNYSIRSLTMPSGYNAVVYSGTGYTRFFISQSFKMNGGLGQWFRSGDTSASSEASYQGRVLIRVEGTGTGANEPARITAGGTHFSATLLVPNANLTLSANTVYFGQALAKSILFEDGYDGTLGRFVKFGGIQTSGLPTKISALGSVTKLEDFADTNQVLLSSVFSGAQSYTVSSKKGLVTADTLAGKLRLRSILDQNGTDTVIVTATNGQGSISDTLYLTLSAVDDAVRHKGSSTGLPDLSLKSGADSSQVLGNYWVDPEGDAITWTVVKNDTNKVNVSIHAPDSVLYHVKLGAVGVDTVVLSAKSGALTIYDTLLVNLGAVKPYKLGDLGSVTKLEDFADTNQVLLSSIFGGANSYTLSTKKGLLTADTLAGNLRLRSILDQNGADTVIVTANNAQGSISDTLYVNLTAVDDAARKIAHGTELGLPDTSLVKGQSVQMLLSSYYADPEGDALSFQVVKTLQNRVQATLSAPDTLKLLSDSLGADTVIVAIQSGLLKIYDTLVVQVGQNAPSKVGDFGPTPIRKDVNFADTLRLDLGFIFKNFTQSKILSNNKIVDASLVQGSLQIVSRKDQIGLDTVIVQVSNGAGAKLDTMYLQVLPAFAKLKSMGTLSLQEDFADTTLISLDSLFRGAQSYEVQQKGTKLSAVLNQKSLKLSSVANENGVDTLLISAVNGSSRLVDTVVVRIAAVNDLPDLSQGILLVQAPKRGMSLGKLVAFDVDGDQVSLRQLNYTPDFGLRGDSLYVKQLFSQEDSLFVIKFELNDGKSTVQRSLTVMVQGQITDLYTPVLGEWTQSPSGMPGFEPSQEKLEVFDLHGQRIYVWTMGKQDLRSAGLPRGIYGVRQGAQTGLLRVKE